MKKLLQYSVELDDFEYQCVVDVEFHVDEDYGADADGNRGEPRLFIDDVKILDVYYEIDGKFTSIVPGITLEELILSKVDDKL